MAKSTSDAKSKITSVLGSVLTHTAKVLAFDRFYVVLYNNITGQLDFPVVALNRSGKLDRRERRGQGWRSREYRPDKYVPDLWFTFEAGSSGGSADFEALLAVGFRYPHPLEDISDVNQPRLPQSWMSVPLLANNHVFGLITLEHYSGAHSYDEKSFEFMSAVARRASGAIHSIRQSERLRVVNEVGQDLTAGVRLTERQILGKIYRGATKLMNTRDMYVALYDAAEQKLSFPLAFQDGERQRNWPSRVVKKEKGGLTDEVIRTGEPLCPANVAVWFTEREIDPAVLPLPTSWLGVPMVSGNRVLGVMSVQNDEVENLFGPDDQEVLQTLATQAAAALASARHVERLRVVNKVGQNLNAGVRLTEQQILEKIHRGATKLMDTRDMYVALYNAGQQMLSFPLAYQDRKRQRNWPSRVVKKEKGGLTDEVIRTGKLLCPANVAAWFEAREIDPAVKPIPKSWLGVPLISEGKVLGVISVQNDEVAGLYNSDDQEILQIMATEAAKAIDNARLYRDLENANRRIAQKAAIEARGLIAADFVHRLNNLAGTIPIWVDLIRQEIGSEDLQLAEVINYLARIDTDVNGLLRAAEQLNTAPKRQEVDVAFMLQSALRQIRIQYRKSIEVSELIDPDLFRVEAMPLSLTTVISFLLSNAVDAIISTGGGTLSVVATNHSQESSTKAIKIDIRDTGSGIPPEILSRLFVPFFSTKGEGRGYGLWRTKTIVEDLGGSITVRSNVGVGSTFTVVLPAVSREK